LKRQLQASFLGGIKLVWKGKILTQFATKKVLGLFCYFLDSPETEFARDNLMLLFWGEHSDTQARYNLRYALWNIRKLFKESEKDVDPLITSRTSCRINPDFLYTTDTQIFSEAISTSDRENRVEQLIKVDQLYKGLFLDGFALRNLSEWEEWLFQRREDFKQQFMNAAVELGNHYLMSHEPTLAIPLFTKALHATQDFEPAHDGMIRAYADQGKLSNALHHYNRYVDIMRRTFNAPPRPDIQALSESLRTGEYSQTGQKASDDSFLYSSGVNVQTQVEKEAVETDKHTEQVAETTEIEDDNLPVTSDFIGRQTEIADFDKVLNEVKAGNGQVLIISGEMGIGKTRLFNELMKKLPPEFMVGIGEAEEIQSIRPLEEILRIIEALKNDDRLPQTSRDSLEKILHESDDLSYENNIESEYIPQKIRKWISDLASQFPIVIALDDMHWVSESALKIFAALSQDIKRMPMLLVGIFRTFEFQSEDEIASSLISIARTGRLWRMDLSSLNQEETISLVRQKSTKLIDVLSEQDWSKVYNYSNGIPLYALELSTFLEEGYIDVLENPILDGKPDFRAKSDQKIVPPLMIKISKLRMSKLPKNFVSILKTASLIIGHFSLELISALESSDQDEFEDHLVRLEQLNFLHHIESEDKILFSFNHQMVKLSIGQSLSPMEKRHIYKKIISTVEKIGESVGSDAMAYYLFNAGDHIAAIPHLIKNIESRLSLGDIQSGIDYSRIVYKIARDKIKTNPQEMIPVIFQHVSHLIGQNKIKEATDALNQILNENHSMMNSGVLKEIVQKHEEMKTMLRNDQEEKPRGLPPLVLVTTRRALANTKLLQGDYEGAFKLLAEAETTLESLPDSPATLRETGMVLQVRVKLKIVTGEYVEALRILNNAMGLMLLHGTTAQLAEIWRLHGEVYLRQNNFKQATNALNQCLELAEQDENNVETAYCRHLQGLLMWKMGDLDEAERLLNLSIEIGGLLPELVEHLPVIQLDLAKVLQAKGKTAGVSRILDDIEAVHTGKENAEMLQEIKRIRKQL